MNLTEKQYARINTVILALIILVTGFVILSPFIPALQFWYKDRFSTVERTNLTTQVEGPATEADYTGPNKIVIPSIFIDQPILEGPNIYTANEGIWRLPWTSTPDRGGNTVLIGHRFMYSQTPAVFYNLDKIRLGDRMAVFWDNTRYVYEVDEIKTVSPQQIDVEAQTDDSRLTLYTCTPLWTSNNRLVIIAKEIKIE